RAGDLADHPLGDVPRPSVHPDPDSPVLDLRAAPVRLAHVAGDEAGAALRADPNLDLLVVVAELEGRLGLRLRPDLDGAGSEVVLDGERGAERAGLARRDPRVTGLGLGHRR